MIEAFQRLPQQAKYAVYAVACIAVLIVLAKMVSGDEQSANISASPGTGISVVVPDSGPPSLPVSTESLGKLTSAAAETVKIYSNPTLTGEQKSDQLMPYTSDPLFVNPDIPAYPNTPVPTDIKVEQILSLSSTSADVVVATSAANYSVRLVMVSGGWQVEKIGILGGAA